MNISSLANQKDKNIFQITDPSKRQNKITLPLSQSKKTDAIMSSSNPKVSNQSLKKMQKSLPKQQLKKPTSKRSASPKQSRPKRFNLDKLTKNKKIKVIRAMKKIFQIHMTMGNEYLKQLAKEEEHLKAQLKIMANQIPAREQKKRLLNKCQNLMEDVEGKMTEFERKYDEADGCQDGFNLFDTIKLIECIDESIRSLYQADANDLHKIALIECRFLQLERRLQESD